MKVLCICLSSAIQRTLYFDSFNTKKVNRTQKFIECAGGKAVNSSRVLEQLEKNSSAVLCPVGIKNKDTFIELAAADKLNVIPVFTGGNTRMCWTIVTKKGETTEVIADETVYSAQKSTEEEMVLTLKKIIKDYDAVIFAGSCPACFSKELPIKICTAIKENNKILLVDFCGENLLNCLKFSNPDFIKINEEEFTATFEKKLSKKNLCNLSQILKSSIIVTRGKKSSLCADKNDFYKIKSEKIVPVNTTACGDSFNAGFIYEYLNTKNIEKSLNYGSHCAALNALSLKPGSLS